MSHSVDSDYSVDDRRAHVVRCYLHWASSSDKKRPKRPPSNNIRAFEYVTTLSYDEKAHEI